MKEIVDFIRWKARKGAVIGLSGGLDSCVVTKLCVEALGRDKVLALIMPDKGEDMTDAISFAKSLGIEYRVIDISGILRDLEEELDKTNDRVVLGNLKPRVRMVILYYYANLLGRIVVGTSNKSEILTGYSTKYGDCAVDIEPIGGLYKTEVKKLARELGIRGKIIEKRPSAGLWKGQTDEGELGIKYEALDSVLRCIYDEKTSAEEASGKTGVDLEKVKEIQERIKRTEHKRKMPEKP
jgi:NAD+ synthase